MLSPAIEAQLAAFLLAVLCASAAHGMPREGLLREARLQVLRDLTEPDFDVLLRQLADKRLVIEAPAVVGPSRWRVTDHGRSVAREQGLA